MGADRIEVESDLLRQQAADVSAAARAVGTAQEAVSSMNLGGGAFGLMCNFLVPVASTMTMAAQATMAQAKAMLEREAEALRATANDFDDLEDNISSEVRHLGVGLGMQ